MDWLIRTKSFLQECSSHIEDTSTSGTEVEAFLAQYLLVVLCSEMQEEIYRVVESRARSCGDDELCSFAVSSSKKLLRSVKVSELSGFVGHFGVERKRRFMDSLDERATLQYNSAVESRHSVAHRSGAQVTLADLASIVSAACEVLDAAKSALIEDQSHNNEEGATEISHDPSGSDRRRV